MSLRDWTWRDGLLSCDQHPIAPSETKSDSCDLHNGSWLSPDSKRTYCWKHYQRTLHEEAIQEDPQVQTERQRIADGLMAWYTMWSKPNPIACTNRSIPSSGMITTWWIKEFADKIRDGTFGNPHRSEPDPLYEID